MVILGVETSCDETAAAVVEATGGLKRPRFKILSNVVSSQVKLHAKYGGVVPRLAAREHEKNLPTVTNLALLKYYHTLEYSKKRKSGRKRKNKPPIDLITVTKGPGLEPCLWRGIEFAKILAQKTNAPIIGVNHLEGHIYSNWLGPVRVMTNDQLPMTKRFANRKIEFPAVCLIVSGGHTELVLMKNYGEYKLLGETRDDAAGEAYDKVARLLGFGFPGGPQIDRLAQSESSPQESALRLPRPMINSKNYDFSFSGLKTAVLYLIRDLKAAGIKALPVEAISYEFQQAVVDVLTSKTMRAANEYKAKTVMVSGGVSANSALRRAFGQFRALFPPRELTTDNAAMIAMAGYINWTLGKRADRETLGADANLRIA